MTGDVRSVEGSSSPLRASWGEREGPEGEVEDPEGGRGWRGVRGPRV